MTVPVQPPELQSVAFRAEAVGAIHRSQRSIVVSRFLRHRLAVVSLVIFAVITLFAFVIIPTFWTWDYTIHREIPSNAAPSVDHPFGTTRAGHDYMAQVMRGVEQSMKTALVAAAMSALLGGILGAVAGYYRGAADSVIMRLVDLLFVIPLLVVALVITGLLGSTQWWHLALVIGAFIWLNNARIVRAQVLSLREQEFIEAARAMGASDARIIFRHLIPNTTSVLIVDFTLVIALAVLVEAALSFIGFGIQPPDVSLGFLISQAQDAVWTRPWLFYFPGVFILLITLCINFIGDGLRDALDPKQTRLRR